MNSDTNPAPRGSIVTLYATGEGQRNQAGADNLPALAPFPRPLLPVSLTIGGYAAEVLFAGGAPGLVGVMQINARIPQGFLPSGSVPVVLVVGTASSQSGVTVVVK